MSFFTTKRKVEVGLDLSAFQAAQPKNDPKGAFF